MNGRVAKKLRRNFLDRMLKEERKLGNFRKMFRNVKRAYSRGEIDTGLADR